MSRCAYKALPLLALLPFALAAADKPEAAVQSARFGLCSGTHRVTCVVDGDTFWYRGAKIRIADINAPEVSQPSCAREAALGERARTRAGRRPRDRPTNRPLAIDGLPRAAPQHEAA